MVAKLRTSGHSIGEAARAADLSPKTIRYYEQIGLIPKAPRRSAFARIGGERIYSEADIGRLRFIRHARLVDLSLDDIRELLKIADEGCPSAHPTYGEVLRRHVHRIDERINHLLGLRSTVYQLLSRGNATDADCSWETCGCMDAERSAKQSETSAA